MGNEQAVAQAPAADGSDQGVKPVPGGADKVGGKEPPATGKTALPVGKTPPVAEVPKKRRYVVDGKTHEIDEKDLDTVVQKGLGAEKKFNEAAKARKEAEMLISMLQRNPMAVLEKVAKLSGGDPRKIVEDWLWENHVKLEQLTPEQREAELNKRKLTDYEKQEQERQERAVQERAEQLKAHYREHYERDIIGALEEGGLPKTTKTVSRMAHYMAQALKIGAKITAKDVIPLVRQDYESEFREIFGPANAEIIARILGDDGLKKIREHDLSRLKAQGAPIRTDGNAGKPVPAESGEKKKKMSPDEWKESLRRKFGD